ncbi:TPA: hypothetical protein NKP43_001302 [Vibrio parahaemolyticus]|nr:MULTISPECIES: hypothetical protein [Vibrio]ELA6659777.1 hypothetical protein [Vibrio alginolyticus]EJE4169405.1 hypothetical protein [Vibrio parahaemolyticus]MBE4272376.1 hypothetical protein [Vibrio parahaemolyticus]MBE4273416.1 hypothetical protein [Vibrio parahaemolyticus]MBE4373259.1 hypothetical protein [Vibrio parahaemolyticus]
MKLNYYTYTIKFKSSGTTCMICVKDIIDFYCSYQKQQAVLEKTHQKTSRKLYFAKAATYLSVYYLMTPTQLHNYRKLDRASGTVEDLQSIIGTASLEKVTYVHLDDQLPVIGIASSHGGATEEDVEYYLNQVLNGLLQTPEYTLELKPINSGVAKNNVKNINLVSEAKVLMRDDSNQFSKLASFLNATSNTDNLEIEIKVKRKAHSRADIKTQIDPLLEIIKNDTNNSDFAEVYLRGKAHSAQETIKDILLDKTMILYDILYPKSGNTIETQIQDKSYANGQVNTLANQEFSKYSSKLKTSAPCPKWVNLKNKNFY